MCPESPGVAKSNLRCGDDHLGTFKFRDEPLGDDKRQGWIEEMARGKGDRKVERHERDGKPERRLSGHGYKDMQSVQKWNSVLNRSALCGSGELALDKKRGVSANIDDDQKNTAGRKHVEL